MTQPYEVAVVGAGISGLYAAWRLCVDTSTVDPSNITILEQSGRPGGRLFTWTLHDFDSSIPADTSVRAELGGMRILNYNLYAYSLALNLGLQLVPFPADVPSNWHYLRGKVLQTQDYPKQDMYPLAPQEQGEMPGDVVYNALVANGNIVPQAQFPTPTGTITQRNFVDWVMKNTQYQGQPSYESGLWNVLVGSGQYASPNPSNVSFQAYEYFVDAGAYDTIPSNWNASVAFSNVLSDFTNSPTYWAIDQGYQAMPNGLQDQLLKANSGMIQFDTQVVNVTRDETLQLFAIWVKGSVTPILAKKVILALPPRALQILAQAPDCILNTADLKTGIQQSTPVPLLKIFLVYDNDWWTQAVGEWEQFTRMTTDLPMRQIYYFGSQNANGKTYHLLQAAYNDSLKAGYWAGLMPVEGKAQSQDLNTDIFGHIHNVGGDSTIQTGMLKFDTTQSVSDFPMFNTIHQQFVTLVQQVASANGGTQVAPTAPIAGAAMNWATEPFGGGVNFWNVGVDIGSTETSAYWSIMCPTTSPLYVIGEGYSLYQGWVEGALWSAEDMLAKFFTLPPPSWLKSVPYSAPTERPPAIAARMGRGPKR